MPPLQGPVFRDFYAVSADADLPVHQGGGGLPSLMVEAEDGAKAVEVYAAEKPDLVFMDITMPNKDGLETLKEIKGMDPGATIVMCSAMGQQAMVIEAIQSGAKDFIVKPFNAERIVQTVNTILGQ